MTAIRINYADRKIILSSAFEKRAFIPGTVEYDQLQAVRRDFPDFALVTRKFKTNTKQEHYHGLTYEYMRDYIKSHEADPKPVLHELEKQIGISKCHSQGRRYPIVKSWFLERYPEIAKFGMNEEELAKWHEKQCEKSSPQQSEVKEDASSDNVTDLPVDAAEERKAS